MRTAILLAILILLAACTAQGDPDDPIDSDDSPPPSVAPGDAPVLVVAEGGPGDGPGLSVAEALTHGPTDDLVTVTGALFVGPDGTMRLCDAIAESFPPQCGGDQIVVEGLDLADVADLQEENGVRWAESMTLFGSVEQGPRARAPAAPQAAGPKSAPRTATIAPARMTLPPIATPMVAT